MAAHLHLKWLLCTAQENATISHDNAASLIRGRFGLVRHSVQGRHLLIIGLTYIGPCVAWKPLQLLCGIFNIIFSGMRGLGIQFRLSCCCCLVVLLLSCCCLIRVSKGEQRRLTDSKCYIFSKSSQQLGFRWEGSKVFQGGWPWQVWKEASSLFLLRPQVLYIFEILSANVTQWEGYQVL